MALFFQLRKTPLLTTIYDENDAMGLAALVRKGEVNSLELVEEAISRIERLNPRLNAVTHKLYDQARASCALPLSTGVFAGVPFLIKDLAVGWQGLPVTYSSKYFKDYIAPSDWDLAKKARATGLIPLGKTNVPELGASSSTEPLLYGPTINPWNDKIIPGGSSGGSSVAVASRMVPLADASDGGGSIRIPAAVNAVVGLKPSRGRMTLGPDVVDFWYGSAVFLCVSRSVRDTAAYLDALSGCRPGEPYALPNPQESFLSALHQAPRRLRIGVTTTNPDASPLHPEVKAAVQHAATLCERLGFDVEEFDFRYDVQSMQNAFERITATLTAAFFEDSAALLGRSVSEAEVEPATWNLIETGKTVSGIQHAGDIEKVRKIARDIAGDANVFDALLVPVLPTPPPPRGTRGPGESDPKKCWANVLSDLIFTQPFNASGQPAITVPLYHTAEDIPVGVQFVARLGDEATLLHIAGRLEQLQPWRNRRPPGC
jgi:amidase